MTITPQHIKTRAALSQAQRLADLLCPVTDAQSAAYRWLIGATASGDLYATIDAMREACSAKVSTPEFTAWATSWLLRVEKLIVNEQRESVT